MRHMWVKQEMGLVDNFTHCHETVQQYCCLLHFPFPDQSSKRETISSLKYLEKCAQSLTVTSFLSPFVSSICICVIILCSSSDCFIIIVEQILKLTAFVVLLVFLFGFTTLYIFIFLEAAL